MAHYTYENLSKDSQELTSNIFQIWSKLNETLIFGYLGNEVLLPSNWIGLAIFSFRSEYDPGFIVSGIVSNRVYVLITKIIVVIARAVHVYPLSWIVNIFRSGERKIKPNYQFMIFFAGTDRTFHLIFQDFVEALLLHFHYKLLIQQELLCSQLLL